MDPGTALAIAGVALALPPLFETYIHGFDLFTAGRNQAETTKKFIAMLGLSKLRLYLWGRNLGLTNEPDHPMNEMLNDLAIRLRIEAALEQLKSLITDGKQLESKYGVKAQPYNPNQIDEPRSMFSETYERYMQRLRKSSQLSKMTTWAIHDEAKFQKMLDEINHFLISLESLNGSLGIQQQPLKDVERTIAKSFNEYDLRLVQSAALASDFQSVGQVANQRLLTLNPEATLFEDLASSISISGHSTPSSAGHISPARPQTQSYFPISSTSNRPSISSQLASPSPPPYTTLASPSTSSTHNQSTTSLASLSPSQPSPYAAPQSATSTMFQHFDEAAWRSYVVAQPDATLLQLEADLDKKIEWSKAAIGAGLVGSVLTMGATLAGSAAGARTNYVYKLQRNVVKVELGRRGLVGKKEAARMEKEKMAAQERVRRWAMEDAKKSNC
ncbi:hypothetical protein MMC30_003079 [Trapelia coarctata]|nr:hypothetical protein [Trapelia coarctata]